MILRFKKPIIGSLSMRKHRWLKSVSYKKLEKRENYDHTRKKNANPLGFTSIGEDS